MPYECDQCGACCRKLIIEIEYVDILREPKLRDLKPFRMPEGGFVDDDDEPITNPDPFMAGAMLACGTTRPCPHDARTVDGRSHCEIYPTRPTCCVGFEVGGRQCQEARVLAGLPQLSETQ